MFASGVWKLEKLESDKRLAGIGVMTPAIESGGSRGETLPEQKFKKKEKTEKKVAKDVQWDKKNVTDEEKPKIAEIGGDGEGDGPGIGKGKGPGDQEGLPEGEICVLPPCGGTAAPLPDPPAPAAPKIVMVPPSVMQGLRISGETQIHPSRVVKTQILADGKSKVIGTLKVCIQTSGAIASATLLTSTKYPEYDQQLLEAARRWHYRPYTVNNVAVGACAAVSFVYTIQ